MRLGQWKYDFAMKISSACLSVLKNFDNSEVNSVFLVSSKSLLLDEAKIGYMEGARMIFFYRLPFNAVQSSKIGLIENKSGFSVFLMTLEVKLLVWFNSEFISCGEDWRSSRIWLILVSTIFLSSPNLPILHTITRLLCILLEYSVNYWTTTHSTFRSLNGTDEGNTILCTMTMTFSDAICTPNDKRILQF